jgi:hypothetical protein
LRVEGTRVEGTVWSPKLPSPKLLNDIFSAGRKHIPIFHLHGSRTKPEQIIITQEDYVALFRPTEYRQIKLALTIKESTTCFLGYSLGDVNVLTALDWSRNVYTGQHGDYPHEIIQVVRADKPRDAPFRSREGILVLETATIPAFFNEYIEASTPLRKRHRTKRDYTRQAVALFTSAEPERIERFIRDPKWRRSVLAMSVDFGVDVLAEFELFLIACFKECKLRSGKAGAFNEYALDLNITLDILEAYPLPGFPPTLLFLAAKNLDRLALYIGNTKGTSWAAKSAWDNRSTTLSGEITEELLAISRVYKLATLQRLIENRDR